MPCLQQAARSQQAAKSSPCMVETHIEPLRVLIIDQEYIVVHVTGVSYLKACPRATPASLAHRILPPHPPFPFRAYFPLSSACRIPPSSSPPPPRASCLLGPFLSLRCHCCAERTGCKGPFTPDFKTDKYRPYTNNTHAKQEGGADRAAAGVERCLLPGRVRRPPGRRRRHHRQARLRQGHGQEGGALAEIPRGPRGLGQRR